MSVATPELISEPFGSSAGGSFITNPIPVASQIGITDGAASFTDGFPPLTMTQLDAGGVPPFGQDMNGILYMITGNIAFISAGQESVWSSTQASAIGGYALGAILARADGSGFWLCTTNNNSTNPDAGGAGWVPAFNYGSTAVSVSTTDVTLTALQYARPFIVVSGTLTGNRNLIFPAFLQQWLVINNTSGAFTLTAKTASGTGTVIPPGGFAGATNIFSDGTNMYTNAISTAGLAPIASPALTGVPTAPTASTGTNTTQIATTAFANAAAAAAISGLAPLASPTFSGVPTAPTPSPGDNTAKLATTAFVETAIGALPLVRFAKTGTLSGGANSISFATPFPTACDSVVVTPTINSATYAITGVSASGFTMNTGAAVPFYYVAYGH
jgi:hypothetical protein